jgi:diguanylate cyclase (GGDEF)-like protein
MAVEDRSTGSDGGVVGEPDAGIGREGGTGSGAPRPKAPPRRRQSERRLTAAGNDQPTTPPNRIQRARQRDETARLSDLTASSRDLAADARDRAAARRSTSLPAPGASGEIGETGDATSDAVTPSGAISTDTVADHEGSSDAGRVAAADRSHAAADRAGSAGDRQRAAADRRQAAADRRQAHVDLETAQLDSLTGVPMRDIGRLNIQDAIDRSRLAAEPFVLAFIDVDGLKALNDSEGHAAGDALLKSVGGVLKSKLRHYDVIARVGGDEFLCGLTNTELSVSQIRFEEIRAAVARGDASGSITVGLASLQETDTLDDLTARADLDMYAHKPASRRAST